MNLYQYLNDRHRARTERRIARSIDDIGKGIVHKAMTWDELQEKWEADEAREEARPLILRKTRDAWWAARRHMRRCTPRSIVNSIVWYHQRGRRGWSDYDAWSFDSYITRVTSQGLARLAANTQSWPGEHSQWPTFGDWQAHLADLAARIGAWDADSFTDRETFEVTRQAMIEFGTNLGHYWD